MSVIQELRMDRTELMDRLTEPGKLWDLLVIGGGATGVGVVLDAASRGYQAALVEQSDFGKGTSSRSTKLVHGGVRYLEQGNISLVIQALRERGILKCNAPHVVSELAFVVPNYEWWEAPFYGIGLRLYDLLAGKYGFGSSRILSREETLERLPTIRTEGLRGGVVYFDGQFDDSRLLIHLVRTAVEQGAVPVNYCSADGFLLNADGIVRGVRVRDLESGREHELQARVAVNATGPFSDSVRLMADPGATPMVSPSQGVHLVLDSAFLPGASAIMVPHTRDGRVMFALPWLGHTLVGTTDTPIPSPELEPRPLNEEVEFILETAAHYLHRSPTRSDVLSAWAGVRPLVRTGGSSNTAVLSRDHSIHIDRSGLLTIAGGKWTTYRHMAEDCVDQAAVLAGLEERMCVTGQLRIHGYHSAAVEFGSLREYGSDAEEICKLVRREPELGCRLHDSLPYIAAEVVWAARSEMARTVEDVLSRRVRALQLNARAAVEMAPRVVELLAGELCRDRQWCGEQLEAFSRLAGAYRLD